VSFDNAPGSGAAAIPTGWQGGKLHAELDWSAAALVLCPDTRTCRVTVEQLQRNGTVRAVVLQRDLEVPAPVLGPGLVVAEAVFTGREGQAFQFRLRTNPPLPAIAPDRPAALLILLPDPARPGSVTEAFEVRPSGSPTPTVVVRVTPADPGATVPKEHFQGRSAFLVTGSRLTLDEAVAQFLVPIDAKVVVGRVSAVSSTARPFVLPPGYPRPEDPGFPQSAKALFQAPQQLTPPAPPSPVLPVPTHIVHHEYFDPADFYGKARKQLTAFSLPATAGVSGYVVWRASAQTLFLADIARRKGTPSSPGPGLRAPQPVVVEAGVARADLADWIALLPDWLAAYNARRGTALTEQTVLSDHDAQRALAAHFHDGLLDDEIRALADANALDPTRKGAAGFARVNTQPWPPGQGPFTDVVDGRGYDRFLYKVQAANPAGAFGPDTTTAGPYYTRPVRGPGKPVITEVLPQPGGLVVGWTLDEDPETVAYLVYRAGTAQELADLRFFGPPDANGLVDPTRVARPEFRPVDWPAVTLTTGPADPRLVALSPDPRLVARDYEGSNMAEVVLPGLLGVTAVVGVFRADEFDPTADPLGQKAFNYWRPPGQRGISQVVAGAGKPVRLTGLRVGLGKGVPVVAVVRTGDSVRVAGVLSARRAGFFDGPPGSAGGLPSRTPPPAAATVYYALVAFDRFGNRSEPSDPVSGRFVSATH
jgi:hypothetical protein